MFSGGKSKGWLREKSCCLKRRTALRTYHFKSWEALAAAYGLPLEPGGSHYVQRLPDGTKDTIRREGKKVKRWYVQGVVEAIETFGHE